MTTRERNWAAGLTAAALAVGAAYVYGGWLPFHELYLAPTAVAVLSAAS